MKRLVALAIPFLLAAMSGHSEASVNKSQRRLVVVSSLETFGNPKYVWLYQFLNASTISLAQTSLGNSYQSVSVLPETSAKKSTFVTLLANLTNQASTSAVDVILSLHGSTNTLWFYDGSMSTGTLQQQLSNIPKRGKLRLMYNLACYGSTHSNEFTASGFRTAIGSRKTNASSASEYPVFLARWKLGHPVNSTIALTNADPALKAADMAAGSMGFADADSYKLISGLKTLNINSDAQ